MQKYPVYCKKNVVEIGVRFGSLTVCSIPYYKDSEESGKHRRQYVDCKCDCGQIKEFVKACDIGRGCVLKYCGRKCPLYIQSLGTDVPVKSKIAKIGDIRNSLTVIQDAFYFKKAFDHARFKYLKCKCVCGKEVTIREDKFLRGAVKSCGCTHIMNPNKKSVQKRNHSLKQNHNLSSMEYEKMLEAQNNKCLICGTTESKTLLHPWLCVDHCHQTGKIRGLLCSKCNAGLGYFEDNTEFLQNAIEYLKKNKI